MSIAETASRVRENIQRVIVGKSEVINLALATLIVEGHILLEDVPGTGKTTLAKSLAASVGCDFQRIQFTPDLLPQDVTGLYYFNQRSQEFEFRPGPIMSQVVLADEINRATPRTQSALLEAMQERQVTLEGTTYTLRPPFIVMATQNPIELEGTFPLPEAQLDRFLIRLSVGYPTEEEENMIVRRFQRDDPLKTLQPVATETDILDATRDSKEVHVSEAVQDYVVNIIRTTRDHSELDLGASPRASMALFRLSQAWAAIDDRDFVLPDDVKFLTPYILSHRIIVSPQTVLRGRSSEEIIMDIVDSVEVPVE